MVMVSSSGLGPERTTLKLFVVTFDLSTPHPGAHARLTALLADEGLSAWTFAGGKEVRLPNTTVTGFFASREAADAAFLRALKALQRELPGQVTNPKRFVVPQAEDGLVVSDQPRPSDAFARAILGMPSAIPAPLSTLGRMAGIRGG